VWAPCARAAAALPPYTGGTEPRPCSHWRQPLQRLTGRVFACLCPSSRLSATRGARVSRGQCASLLSSALPMRIHYPCNLPRALPAATSHSSLLYTASAPMPPQAYTLYIQASMHACLITGLQATQRKRAGCTRDALGPGTPLVRQTTAAVSVRAVCICIPGTHAFQVGTQRCGTDEFVGAAAAAALRPCPPYGSLRSPVSVCDPAHDRGGANAASQAMRRSARRRDAAFAIAHSWAQIPLTVTSAPQLCGM